MMSRSPSPSPSMRSSRMRNINSATSSELADNVQTLCQLIKSRALQSDIDSLAQTVMNACNGPGKKQKTRMNLRFMVDRDNGEMKHVLEAVEMARNSISLSALIRVMESFINIPRNTRRVRLLVSLNAVHSLTRSLQYILRFGQEDFFSSGTVQALVTLLLLIAHKDRKFALKFRLSGALQQILTDTMANPIQCLMELVIFASKSVAGANMALRLLEPMEIEMGQVHTDVELEQVEVEVDSEPEMIKRRHQHRHSFDDFFGDAARNGLFIGRNREFVYWILSSMTKPGTDPEKIRRNCEILFYLCRAKKNRHKLLQMDCVPTLLHLLKTYMGQKTEEPYTEICLVTLGCLRQLSKSKTGKEQLVSVEGLSVCEQAIRSSVLPVVPGGGAPRGAPLPESAARLRDLQQSLCSLCLRCLPSQPIPLTASPFAITFQLPTSARQALRKIAAADQQDLSGGSDGEEDEDDEEDIAESDEESEQSEFINAAKSKVKKASELANYRNFFVELNEGALPSSSGDVSAINGVVRKLSPSLSRDSSSDSIPRQQRIVNGRGGKRRSSSFGTQAPNDSAGVAHQRSNSGSRNRARAVVGRTGVASNNRSERGSPKITAQRAVRPLKVPPPEQRQRKSSMIECAGIYAKTTCNTRHVMPFVKMAYPDMVQGYPDLPLQPLKDFSGALVMSVLRDLKRFQSANVFTPKVVFDLDSLVTKTNGSKLGIVQSSKNLGNNDLANVGVFYDFNHLVFESRFESGNLRRAVQTSETEYELYLSPDVNQLHQHFQWFYFEVSNMKSELPYTFKIVNCLKSYSMFNFGMQPVLFSVTEAAQGRAGWVRAGHAICYYRNLYTQPNGSKASFESKGYYTAEFTITFRHAADICYVAYHFPYTYTAMKCHLPFWLERKAAQVYCRQDTLCTSLAGNDVPLLTISAYASAEEMAERPIVFLSSRVHPGESNASWMMHGALRYLLGDHPKAAIARKLFLFKIVPMLNPDGVINGSHRCSLAGQDLNRQYTEPSANLHPTVYHTKNLLNYLESIGRSPLVYCDFHGHSRKSNVFVYGNNPEESWYVPDQAIEHEMEHLELPEILDAVAPAFCQSDCRFAIQKGKESCARIAVWRQLGIRRTYTMESTYCGFDQGPYTGFHVGTRELMEMGEKFIESLLFLHERLELKTQRQLKGSDHAYSD